MQEATVGVTVGGSCSFPLPVTVKTEPQVTALIWGSHSLWMAYVACVHQEAPSFI